MDKMSIADKRVPSLSATNLSIGYHLKGKRNKVVHEALELSLYPGEVTCLLGLNGAGKSTLIRTLCGFQPKLGGNINLMGKSIDKYSQREISLNIGVVLTEKTNAGGITVYDLVGLGRHPYTGFFGQLKEIGRASCRERVCQYVTVSGGRASSPQ